MWLGEIQPESPRSCGVNCLTPRPASSVMPGLSHEVLGVQPRLVRSLRWL